MAKSKNPCITCGLFPHAYGKRKCIWCWLLDQPIDVQIIHAGRRRRESGLPPSRPKEAGPDGHGWCSGCASWIPKHYMQGSRCRAHDSQAKHGSHVERTYGISEAQYELLFNFQGGRCALCRRRALKRRLAVDHDHSNGEVRGLLCADDERGCNHAVLGLIESSTQDTALDMARRIVAYLERTPVDRIRAGEDGREFATRPKPIRDYGPPPF